MGLIVCSAGGGTSSDDVTATKAQVLEGYTAVTSDSDDEPIEGTLPLNKVLSDAGGTLPLNKVLANYGGTLPLDTVLETNGGTMKDNGTVKSTLVAGESYTIPNGFHSGNGTVNAKDLESQTVGNAVNSDLVAGKTAWVNGRKITGNAKKIIEYGIWLLKDVTLNYPSSANINMPSTMTFLGNIDTSNGGYALIHVCIGDVHNNNDPTRTSLLQIGTNTWRMIRLNHYGSDNSGWASVNQFVSLLFYRNAKGDLYYQCVGNSSLSGSFQTSIALMATSNATLSGWALD